KALDYCRQAESHAPFRDEQGVCCSEDLPGGTHNPEESVVKLEEQAELGAYCYWVIFAAGSLSGAFDRHLFNYQLV
ncbi:MAG: hypothetical protein Q7J85_07870, partial [Bacillota bacterium]|nr:hypothetical protein [Bacillota bacterium]